MFILIIVCRSSTSVFNCNCVQIPQSSPHSVKKDFLVGIPTGAPKYVDCTDMIVWFSVCFLSTSEQLTAVKLLMKSESASETGWWMKMVINAACFIPSSSLLLHAICLYLIVTLSCSLTDTNTLIHPVFQLFI